MDHGRVATNPKYSVPELKPVALRRQRLLDLLYENIDQPLQLVCAPAGYGKTTVLADFARDTDLSVCWYSVDELDSDPFSFLRHIGEAIESRFPGLSDLRADTQSSTPLGLTWQVVATALLDRLQRDIPEFFILIIDDFHIISGNPEVGEAADLLIRRLPDNCRLIVSAREIPQVASIPRLVSQRKVAGLGSAELRFSADEIRALLKTNFDLEVTAAEAHRLQDESEGWITSVLLTTHSLWKGLFSEVMLERGRRGLLFEYIVAEVFSQQTQRIQEFLLSTSVCSRFDASLCEALTDVDAAGTLREIETKNLFISRLGVSQPWYVYHHLLRDFLRNKLKSESPARYLSLSAKAGDYHLSIGERRTAIQYFIQGEEFERGLDLVEEQAESMAHEGLWETLGNWLEQIPAEHLSEKPGVLLYLSRFFQLRGKNDEAIEHLIDAIDAFRRDGERALEARALMARSVSLRYKGAYQMAIRDARAALKLAREYCTVGEEADAHNSLGTAYAQQGRFRRAEGEFKAALTRYQDQGNLFQLSEINDRLGSVYSELGDAAKAVTHYEVARQGWRKLGNQRKLAVTLNNMAVLYFQQARFEMAEPLARESIEIAQSVNSLRDEAYATTTLADSKRECGEHAAALKSYEKSLILARECMETHLVVYGLVGLAETLRLTGDNQKARSSLSEALVIATEQNQDFEMGLGLTTQGIIEYSEGRYEEGEATLTQAYELLEQTGHKTALARACLHLAQVLFLSKKHVGALELTHKVAQICEELGHERFLLGDAGQVYLLVQYASSSGKSKKFFERIAAQLSSEVTQSTSPRLSSVVQSTGPTIAAPTLGVTTLGSLTIEMDENVIASAAWGSAKAREMFLFMLSLRRPLHKEKIVEALWPDIPVTKANSNFHSTLYRVRKALYPNCVYRDGETYALNAEWSYRSDADEFARLLDGADNLPENAREREELLGRACDLYKGPFLEEIESGWCIDVKGGVKTYQRGGAKLYH